LYVSTLRFRPLVIRTAGIEGEEDRIIGIPSDLRRSCVGTVMALPKVTAPIELRSKLIREGSQQSQETGQVEPFISIS